MAKEFDIFSVGVSDLDTGSEKKGGSDLYAPKPEQGSDGTYSSQIRFLPNPSNPRKPFIRKWVYWLTDADGKGFYVDSPSTVGDKCPIQDMFFKLRNSDSAVDNKMSEELKRKEVYYSLVQIVTDPHNPALEGQIKIFKFGYKIKAKIDDELNPKFDDPVQVFDPFEGKNFELSIFKKGGYPNYDSCKFLSKTSAMVLEGEPVNDSAESRTAILAYLNDAPKLDSWDYTPWTTEQANRVNGVLSMFASPGSSIASVTQQTMSTKPSADIKTEAAAETATATVKAQTATTEASAGGDEKLDDFLEGLDL
jgi:hypothetical protein